jgi:AraC-like DNA-binding protein
MLFGLQRADRIDSRGASSRQVARECSDGEEDQRDHRKRDGIVRCDAEQVRGQPNRSGPRHRPRTNAPPRVGSTRPAGVIWVLEEALLSKARGGLDPHPAVRYALDVFDRSNGARAVGDVVQGIGISSRRFWELFRNEVGLSPKAFCRICRFNEVLRRIAADDCRLGRRRALVRLLRSGAFQSRLSCVCRT